MAKRDPREMNIRTIPQQQRSAERIDSILNTTAQLIDKRGIRHLTMTGLAAESGTSVGGVYRYFSDLTAILDGLAARNVRRYIAEVERLLPASQSEWQRGTDTIVDAYVEMMRSEPGFVTVSFGDLLEENVRRPRVRNGKVIAEVFDKVLQDRYGFASSPEILFAFEVSVEITQALVGVAFQSQAGGDERLISKACEIVKDEITKAVKKLPDH